MQPLEPGEPATVGPYRLLGRLGAGGMGRVYLGRSAGGRTVAVKVVHPHFALDEEFRARFRREADAARRVGGRWTAPVLDADPDASVPWIATGYVAGPPLSSAVPEHGPLPGHSVRALGAGLAEALRAVHALDLVHRDVKPSNVLLTPEGPRLIDFGIARATDGTASLTSTGVSVGSPGYMSPEQILGKGVTGAADIFSLGAVLAYAATGRAPFPGDSSAALLYKVVHEEPELGALQGELRELVAACLAKDPSARPAPQDVARALAPEGVAALLGQGWLPGPLVEQVSRSAVSLLNLEAAEPEQASGPGGGPAFGPVSGPGPGPAFGPGGGPASGPVSESAAGPASGPASDPVSGPVSGPLDFSRPAIGVFGPPAEPMPPSAGDRPPARRTHGRRVSCTVALTVAGALAAVTVGGTHLLGLWPGGGPGGRNGEDDVAARPPATSPSPQPATTQDADGAYGTLPEAFVGTWSGPAVERTGLPHGQVTAEFQAGAKGEDVLRTTNSISLLGVEITCHGIGRLVSATAREVRIEERPDPDRPGAGKGKCTGGRAELTFTLGGDGTLRYQSDEEAAGKPSGTLAKSGEPSG
ncbi:serine/threonine-protein kinase [Streptomyces sp. MUM 178J]|uniref:serine/threonine-protein kinase n=1 Tax=Streptomyces sp. MUM 178J TaxID=2791991 RepID=UPI001F043EFD|nr:serine/threonine-protein kinase [Streptomyces sp. MUM 178J]WRQ83488.1 serine/threonine-protein kinase [Streptomyces sp. MUM 178J]